MTLKEALDSGYCSLEDDIDFDDTPQGEKNACLKLEIERLNNIIKEVREYIEKNWISQKDADNYRFDDEELDIEISDIAVLFDILDKEVN